MKGYQLHIDRVLGNTGKINRQRELYWCLCLSILTQVKIELGLHFSFEITENSCLIDYCSNGV
jgi:hypothetical protein